MSWHRKFISAFTPFIFVVRAAMEMLQEVTEVKISLNVVSPSAGGLV